MAWTHLQGAGANSAGNTTIGVAYGTALSSGSKLIAYVIASTGLTAFPSTTAVSDGTNSFTKVADGQYHNTAQAVYDDLSVWVLDTPSGDVGTKPTITATISGAATSSGLGILIQEVSGLQTGTSCLDGTAAFLGAFTQSGASVPFPTYSSSVTNEYLVEIYTDWGSSFTLTAPTGYSGPDTNASNGNAQMGVAWKNSTGASETGSWSVSSSINNVTLCGAVAFKLAGSSVTASAGLASVTVAANNPSVNTGGNATAAAGLASVTVAGLAPSVALDTPGVAMVTAAALVPSVIFSPSVVGVGGVTVGAFNATARIGAVTTAPSTVTGAANNTTSTGNASVTAGDAQANAAAFNPSLRSDASPTAGNAAVSVASFNAGGSQGALAAPSVANVTVAANNNQPVGNAGLTTVVVAAYNATVSIGASTVNVTPGVANVTVAAVQPAAGVTLTAVGVANVTAVGVNPHGSVAFQLPTVTVTVAAYGATIPNSNDIVTPPVDVVAVTAQSPTVVVSLPPVSVFSTPVATIVPPVAEADSRYGPSMFITNPLGSRLMAHFESRQAQVNVFLMSDGTYQMDYEPDGWPNRPPMIADSHGNYPQATINAPWPPIPLYRDPDDGTGDIPNQTMNVTWYEGNPMYTPIEPYVVKVYYGRSGIVLTSAEAASLTAAGFGGYITQEVPV